MNNLQPHQLRVIGEKTELEIRIFALEQFLSSPLFSRIDPMEQTRLHKQVLVMNQYADILKERIDAFPKTPEVDLNNPGPRGQEKSIPITELNPELAGMAVFNEAVLIGAKPIDSVDTFAMMVDHWHGQKMEHGNRLLSIPEGTEIEVEDVDKPGEIIAMDLKGAYLQVFRVGVLATLQVFKDLPFGASIEEETNEQPAG